jgi:integrase
MLATYKYVFNRKNERLKRGETALVQLRVTINRQQKYFSTGIYLEKHQWSGADNSWVVGTPVAADYNALLLEIITKLRKAEVQAAQAGQPLSHTMVHKIIKGEDTGSFVDFMLDNIEKRNDISESTKRSVRCMANKLKGFGIVKFSDLTLENIQRVNNELLKVEKESSVDRFHANISCYVTRAVRLDLFPVDKNPYLKFDRKRPKFLNRKYLTADELLAIERAAPTTERLRLAKDMFLFCCNTGLSYGDLQALKPSNIVVESGKLFIKTFREKTDEKAAILLFEKAKAVLQKYKDKRSGYCFPSFNNSTLNSWLQQLSKQCGLNKNLTIHMARHTFATTVMLANGVSLEVTQKALGHANINTTQLYAKMVDSRVANEMGEVERKMHGK